MANEHVRSEISPHDFELNASLLMQAIDALFFFDLAPPEGLSRQLPKIDDQGLGIAAALGASAPIIIGDAARLDLGTTLSHMDPPSPLVAWAGELWNARLNQNLLHLETSPAASLVEQYLIGWLAPFFGMDGGHFTDGSTLANLTALWAARDLRGVDTVVASSDSHISVRKAAHILGLFYCPVPVDEHGRLTPGSIPSDLSRCALVLTAGTTSTGAIDPFDLEVEAAWTHVDAAWAGPFRLSPHHSGLLDGIERADSVCVSAHKLFFQPKGSAIIMFRDTWAAHKALQAEAGYLAAPNIGVLGSRPAAAVPLYLSLLAWGQRGLARQLDRCMEVANLLADWIESRHDLELYSRPVTGVLLWRSRTESAEELLERLPGGLASKTVVNGESWIRNVAANPLAKPSQITAAIADALAWHQPEC